MMSRTPFATVFFLVLSCTLGPVFSSLKENIDGPSHTSQIISRHGYPSESHTFPTADGYLLTVQRIPYGKDGPSDSRRQPVLLHHGLLGMSSNWVVIANASLAFDLADAGYDVWLANCRGNIYSMEHKTLSSREQAFWDFSFDEIGRLDLPALLKFIADNTNNHNDTVYIGHSMGTTAFFIYSSTFPEEAKQYVSLMIALAPVAYMTNVQSPIRYLTPWANDAEWIAQHIGLYNLLPCSKFMRFLERAACEKNTRELQLCENLIFLLCGFDKNETVQENIQLFLEQPPAGASTKSVMHYAQEISSGGRFQRYDYGPKENMKRYGSSQPPQYNIEAISVPVYFMYASNDWLAATTDVESLYSEMSNGVGLYKVPTKEFNHLDFLLGRHARPLVYNKILDILKGLNEILNEYYAYSFK